MERKFESLWNLDNEVSITFPGNGTINRSRVIKVSFTKSYEPMYDVEVPFVMDSVLVHGRLHGLKEWHLRNPETGKIYTPADGRMERAVELLRYVLEDHQQQGFISDYSFNKIKEFVELSNSELPSQQ